MITPHGWPVALTPLAWPRPQVKCMGPPTCPECAAFHLAAEMLRLALAGDGVRTSDMLASATRRGRPEVLGAALVAADEAMDMVKAELERQIESLRTD